MMTLLPAGMTGTSCGNARGAGPPGVAPVGASSNAGSGAVKEVEPSFGPHELPSRGDHVARRDGQVSAIYQGNREIHIVLRVGRGRYVDRSLGRVIEARNSYPAGAGSPLAPAGIVRANLPQRGVCGIEHLSRGGLNLRGREW